MRKCPITSTVMLALGAALAPITVTRFFDCETACSISTAVHCADAPTKPLSFVGVSSFIPYTLQKDQLDKCSESESGHCTIECMCTERGLFKNDIPTGSYKY